MQKKIRELQEPRRVSRRKWSLSKMRPRRVVTFRGTIEIIIETSFT